MKEIKSEDKSDRSVKQSTLRIRVYGDPCLRKKSVPFSEVGVSERILIEAMIRTMYETDGIGLAAPQIGINKQLFVADMGEGPHVFINPKIISQKGSWEMEEGCLSFPGIGVNIKRAKVIKVEYRDENNTLIRTELKDLMARIFLHENDHLLGKAIIDYLAADELAAIQDKLEELKKQSQSA